MPYPYPKILKLPFSVPVPVQVYVPVPVSVQHSVAAADVPHYHSENGRWQCGTVIPVFFYVMDSWWQTCPVTFLYQCFCSVLLS